MKVLLVASEVSPLVKVGGMADVIGSLPIAIKELKIDIRIAIPYYQPLYDQLTTSFHNKESCIKASHLKDYKIEYAGKERKTSLFETTLPNTNVLVYLIHNEEFISNGGVYFSPEYMSSPSNELDRFAFFSKAISAIFSYQNVIFNPEIFHCNDWHTGLIPQILQTMHNYARESVQKTIFTIHNLAYQGFTKLDTAEKLGLDVKHDQTLRWDAADDNLDMVLQGIVGSDFITTVSEKYSEEIQTPEFGEGLHDILATRKDRLLGILNGISYDVFDPSKDTYIWAKYTDADWVDGKRKNKIELQKELNLETPSDRPLLGIISRLANQKGLDLVADSIERIIDIGYQVVLLGTGDPLLEARFKEFTENPTISGDYAGLITFSEELARKIYASSDMFLIPSRYEPSGLTQMIAMKYGSVPIVRATGGLFDTVQNNITGFAFDKFSTTDMLDAMKRAIISYSDKNIWCELVKNCFNKDFSWDVSAKKYAILYQKVLNLN